MGRKVILRADGNQQIGLGHVYRLLALAEMLYENYYLIFAIRKPEPFLADLIKNTCHKLHVLPAYNYVLPDERSISEEIPFDLADVLKGDEIVVTDGYWFGINFQKAVKDIGCKLVCIDDLAEAEFVADVVINHAPGLDHSIYKSVAPHTKLCVGLDYMILRPEFFRPRAKARLEVTRILICFGGSDTKHLTFDYASKILVLDPASCLQIVYSQAFSQEQKELLVMLHKKWPSRVNLYHSLNANELVEIIDSCSHAVVSASTISLEVVARGLTPIIGYYVSNQRHIYDGLIKLQLASGLEDLNDANEIDSKLAAYLKNRNFRAIDSTLNSENNILRLIRSL